MDLEKHEWHAIKLAIFMWKIELDEQMKSKEVEFNTRQMHKILSKIMEKLEKDS
jgi:hypothetical protein